MKKYTAPTIAEAMKQIRSELGEDAVILNSKVVTTKKFLGLVKKKHFEVVAGVDRFEPKPVQTMPTLSHPEPTMTNNTNSSATIVEQPKPSNPVAESAMSEELKKEIHDLKTMMKSLKKQSEQLEYPEGLVYVIEFLKNQELDEQLITEISDELFDHLKKGEASRKELFQMAKDSLHARLQSLPYGGIDYAKKYIHVLGPTGVGKTTTIAKMAARAVLEKKKKIGFITTDTYRIAAIEQLKTYAGLLQAPVEIVYNADDYKQALQKMDHLDLIFVDTAGRNYKESKYVDDLKDLIEFEDEAQSFLVLALTAKQKDLEIIIDKFATVPIEKFIFTKLDETNSIGTMFNLMIKYNKGLAYYTNGQEVPEDIEQVNLNDLLDMFFQGELK